MNKNIKVAKQLVKLAKNLIALDEEGDGSGFQGLHDHDNYEQERLDLAQKEGKKYILHHKEGRFWRIMACKNFGSSDYMIKKGAFGGLIQKEENLSHEGNCWVYNGAQVYWDAKVYGDAIVYNDAKVYDKAKVCGNAVVTGNVSVSGYAMVTGNAKVYDNAQVRDYAKIYGNAQVYDNAKVYGDAKVYDAWVRGNSKIHGNAKVDYDVYNQEITK